MIKINSSQGEELVIDTNKKLGSGGFATVYRGTFQGENVAVKKLERKMSGNKLNNYYDQEVQNSKKIRDFINKNMDGESEFLGYYIVQILDVIEQTDIAYIIMELCETDLRQYMKKQKDQIKLHFAIQIIEMISEGIKVLHHIKIVHRDLKPENIFEFKNVKTSWYKVADYGLGKSSDLLTTAIGTIQYMAPEMLDIQCSSYDEKVDIWAMGAILHELITGVTLFNGRTQADIRNSILKFTSYVDLRKQAEKNKQILSKTALEKSLLLITDEEVIQLIDQMLQKDSRKRPEIKIILKQIYDISIRLEPKILSVPPPSEIKSEYTITPASNDQIQLQQQQQQLQQNYLQELLLQEKQKQFQQEQYQMQQSQINVQQNQQIQFPNKIQEKQQQQSQQEQYQMQKSQNSVQQNQQIQFPNKPQILGNINKPGGINNQFNIVAGSSQIDSLLKENEKLQSENQSLKLENTNLLNKISLQIPNQIQMQGNLNKPGGSQIQFNNAAESQIAFLKKENEQLRQEKQKLKETNQEFFKQINQQQNIKFELEESKFEKFKNENIQTSYEYFNKIFK